MVPLMDWLLGSQLRHSVWGLVHGCLSGCHSSVVEHWWLKPGACSTIIDCPYISVMNFWPATRCTSWLINEVTVNYSSLYIQTFYKVRNWIEHGTAQCIVDWSSHTVLLWYLQAANTQHSLVAFHICLPCHLASWHMSVVTAQQSV